MNGLKSISLSCSLSGRHSCCIGLFWCIIHTGMLESVGISRVNPEERSFCCITTFNSKARFNTCIVKQWEGSKSWALTVSWRVRSACMLLKSFCVCHVFVAHIFFPPWRRRPAEVGEPQSRVVLNTFLSSLKSAEGTSFSEACACLVCMYPSLLCMASCWFQKIAMSKEFPDVWSKNLR